ncbi:MAG: NAD(P)-dependent oxidoreductase, partial [Candidatus Auribacterota bacterium]|nr:NAD(P)-dependent oxidoreductase [Candidatus Auribacterota bacterium]
MKVLITGGAGFLGLHLAHRFSKMGWSVTLLDIADVELSEYPERISFIKADIKDLQMVKNSVEGKDLIIHA